VHLCGVWSPSAALPSSLLASSFLAAPGGGLARGARGPRQRSAPGPAQGFPVQDSVEGSTHAKSTVRTGPSGESTHAQGSEGTETGVQQSQGTLYCEGTGAVGSGGAWGRPLGSQALALAHPVRTPSPSRHRRCGGGRVCRPSRWGTEPYQCATQPYQCGTEPHVPVQVEWGGARR